MTYRISGIDPSRFQHLFGLDEVSLAKHGASRHVVKEGEGVPDRIELRDAVAGEQVLLLNYTHQPADNAYHASHAIFIVEGAWRAAVHVDSIPEVMRKRLISLRGFDARHALIVADVVPGTELDVKIADYFSQPAVAYLHAHYAKQGCFAALIERI